MTLLERIDFLGDERTQAQLLRGTIAVLAVGVVLGVVLAVTGAFGDFAELSRQGLAAWLVCLAAGLTVPLPVHELIHGALFRLMGGPGTKVTYGASSGMLYASCPGLVLPRTRMAAVLLAPAIVLSVVLLGLGARLALPLLGYVCFVAHLSGCVGDLLAATKALANNRCTHLQDTEVGVDLLAE